MISQRGKARSLAHRPLRTLAQRDWRRRAAAGQACALSEYDSDTVAFLIAHGWLDIDKRDEKRAIGDAIGRMLMASARLSGFVAPAVGPQWSFRGRLFDEAALAAILKAQKNRCAICRISFDKAKRHVDHIIPVARGGSNDPSNLQYLCASCNVRKGAYDPLDFMRKLGRLL